ncbi:MAG: hypothetical protein RL095_2600 [Verrucomicrobiota bacterium]
MNRWNIPQYYLSPLGGVLRLSRSAKPRSPGVPPGAALRSSRSDGMIVAGGFNPRWFDICFGRRGSDAVTSALEMGASLGMSSCRFATAVMGRHCPGVETPGYMHTVASRRAHSSWKLEPRTHPAGRRGSQDMLLSSWKLEHEHTRRDAGAPRTCSSRAGSSSHEHTRRDAGAPR